MTNEYGVELDRNGYAPSIVQDDTDCCYICFGSSEKLDRHEIFGGSNRDKCKRLGLWVVLCHKEHHIFGENAVHNNRNVDLALKEAGQKAVMERYGWSVEQFIHEFGRNYL